MVRLEGCPVDLSLRQDQHLDDLVRELTLMSADHHNNPASAELAKRLEAILRAPAHARLAGRRQARLARSRGERLVDVEMAMPREFSADVRQLHEAVTEADVHCEEQRLLTLTSPADLRELRTLDDRGDHRAGRAGRLAGQLGHLALATLPALTARLRRPSVVVARQTAPAARHPALPPCAKVKPQPSG